MGQINLQGAYDATKELAIIAGERRLGVALVQEQYPGALPSGVVEFGVAAKAAIVIFDPNIRCAALLHLSSAHCAVAYLGESGDAGCAGEG